MSALNRIARGNRNALNWFANDFFDRYGLTAAYMSYGFVFFYFGLQKPIPIRSPVYEPLSLLAGTIGAPAAAFVNFVGLYEMTMGVLFFFRRLGAAFWMFLVHQTTTLVALGIVAYYAFQPPWLTVMGLRIPWVLDSFAAFTLKNLIFIGGFILLVHLEYGD